MDLVNIKTNRTVKCAFCRHWYDPTNVAIRPKNPAAGLWEYDSRMKSKCSMKNIETVGGLFCGKFEMKQI